MKNKRFNQTVTRHTPAVFILPDFVFCFLYKLLFWSLQYQTFHLILYFGLSDDMI